jgi:hypothetical protein
LPFSSAAVPRLLGGKIRFIVAVICIVFAWAVSPLAPAPLLWKNRLLGGDSCRGVGARAIVQSRPLRELFILPFPVGSGPGEGAQHQEEVAVIARHVNARQRGLLAGLLGLWMMHAPAALAVAQEIPTVPPPPEPAKQREPARLGVQTGRPLTTLAVSLNQQMAERIAATLKGNRQLRQYSVEVTYQDGVARLSGHVNGQAQHDEVLRTVQGTPGVERVVDLLETRHVAGVRPAQNQAPPFPSPFAPPAPGAPPFPPPPGAPGLAPVPLGPPLNGPPNPEPTPIFQAPMGPSTNMPPPRMPPNAWPTYAPYNNYSRVAYPTLYPYQSWPFIGPNYPFPKIPPGWRSISLEWNDGSWWYGKNACSHDWWRIRYW